MILGAKVVCSNSVAGWCGFVCFGKAKNTVKVALHRVKGAKFGVVAAPHHIMDDPPHQGEFGNWLEIDIQVFLMNFGLVDEAFVEQEGFRPAGFEIEEAAGPGNGEKVGIFETELPSRTGIVAHHHLARGEIGSADTDGFVVAADAEPGKIPCREVDGQGTDGCGCIPAGIGSSGLGGG